MTNAAAIRRYSRSALAQVAARLARGLRARFGEDAELAPALDFAERHGAELASVAAPPGHPLERIAPLAGGTAGGADTAARLRDLLLLACLPLEHEGYASLFRHLHADRQPLPSVALALHWLEGEGESGNCESGNCESGNCYTHDPYTLRDEIEDLLCHTPLARFGLLRLAGDGPWHSRDLLPGPGVWEALMARDPELDGAALVSGYAGVPGLEPWLSRPEVAQATVALARGLPCLIALVGGDARMRATRALALLGAAPASALRVRIDAGDMEARAATAYTAAFLHQACLWLDVADDETPGKPLLERIEVVLPVLASAADERQLPALGLPLLRLPVEALAPTARRSLWQSLLPDLGERANLLAARYPIEPNEARDVVGDLALRQEIHGQPLEIEDVADCLRARTAWHARPGIRRLRPRAGWDELLMSVAARRQLEGAVQRVSRQITVLDDWGFAQGRQDRRGVRMLFHGAPGTGKSLAAEVMARALGVDLLVVDIASLVSKWIGETEKNLAAVFDLAERSRALLLFDEADALFAKRTDNQDAHDRYANLETAYLLQRLERYEGVAVLTTNLRGNLDNAFSRRFEFIVGFPEPDAADRQALWRMHLPPLAPLAEDVDLTELAQWYALSGAQIKNAALAAAFLAAAAGQDIQQMHFLLAIEREFDKAGRAHPGYPPSYSPNSSPPPAAYTI
jgi:hypothetical protein